MLWLYIWLGVVAVTLIVEFLTMELVSVWLSIGALVAMILAACGVGYEIQIVVMIIVSISCLLGLRKITLKYLNKNKDKTNTDLLIGTKTKLLSNISEDDMGSVKINGVVWSAVSENNEPISQESLVEIKKIEGNKLIVKKVEQKDNLKETNEQKIEEIKE